MIIYKKQKNTLYRIKKLYELVSLKNILLEKNNKQMNKKNYLVIYGFLKML